MDTKSPNQELTFRQLQAYCQEKGVLFSDIRLLTSEGKYNMLARLLADNGGISIMVSRFRGSDESAEELLATEFGSRCLLRSIDGIIDLAGVTNIVKKMEEPDGSSVSVPLFDQKCFEAALVTVFLEHRWKAKSTPRVCFFDDRVEIMGVPVQKGEEAIEGSINMELRSLYDATHPEHRNLFLALKRLGEEAFTRTDSILRATVPYHWTLQHFAEPPKDYLIEKLISLSGDTEKKVLSALRKNPRMSNEEIASLLGENESSVERGIERLKKLGVLVRRDGYWEVIDE